MKLENLVRTNQRRELERALKGMSKDELARHYAVAFLILQSLLRRADQ